MKKLGIVFFALMALLLLSPAALAVKSTKDVNKLGKFNFLALKLDAGVPDGIGASLVGRPLKFIRLELGGTTVLTGGGVRGGVTISVPWYLSPSATVEAGYQWGGDINQLVAMFGMSNPNISLLRDVQYSYWNFHGGLEFGHPNWFMFFLHAGYSYISYETRGLQEFVREQAGDNSITVKEATATVWTPSAKLGFVIYF